MIVFRLKEIMEEKNLKISDLNEQTGISRNSISSLLNGKTRGIQFDTLEKITLALNVDVADLFKNVFNELIIKLNDISSVETYRRSRNFKKKDNLIVKKYAVTCDLIEDNDLKKGFIPYEIFIELKPHPEIEIRIDFLYSNLFNYLENFLADNKFKLLLVHYLSQKIYYFELQRIKEIKSLYNISDEKVFIHSSSPGISIHNNLCDNKGILEDTSLNEIINELSLNSNYNYTYGDKITVSHKGKK
ncbi:helix-turn-helix domain-containing protein [Staphylococcus epidermidis]|uniref:helix-turn-helix domain-containing protein n=1 Tax=Staphylococcus epidermidis TaxID=1282 RepID=UPI0011A78E8E|nr:helix-turn-helix transcriptional regulator [Staphylococcus epidermidis]